MAQGQEMATASYLPTQQDWTCSKTHLSNSAILHHSDSTPSQLFYYSLCPMEHHAPQNMDGTSSVSLLDLVLFGTLGQDVASAVNLWYVT